MHEKITLALNSAAAAIALAQAMTYDFDSRWHRLATWSFALGNLAFVVYWVVC